MWGRNADQLPLACAPTGDGTHKLGMCPDQELNRQPFGLQGNTQPAEPRWPGLFVVLSSCFSIQVFKPKTCFICQASACLCLIAATGWDYLDSTAFIFSLLFLTASCKLYFRHCRPKSFSPLSYKGWLSLWFPWLTCPVISPPPVPKGSGSADGFLISYWVLLKVLDLSSCHHPNEFAADELLLIGNAPSVLPIKCWFPHKVLRRQGLYPQSGSRKLNLLSRPLLDTWEGEGLWALFIEYGFYLRVFPWPFCSPPTFILPSLLFPFFLLPSLPFLSPFFLSLSFPPFFNRHLLSTYYVKSGGMCGGRW